MTCSEDESSWSLSSRDESSEKQACLAESNMAAFVRANERREGKYKSGIMAPDGELGVGCSDEEN